MSRLTSAVVLTGVLALVSGCGNSGSSTALPRVSNAERALPDSGSERVKIRSFSDLPVYGPYYHPLGITSGPKGLLWIIDTIDQDIGEEAVVSIATSGKQRHVYYYPGTSTGAGFVDIAAGSDGALWMTDDYEVQIVALSTRGVFTKYPLTNRTVPIDITAGPDRALWFTAQGPGNGSSIERITTKGQISMYTVSVDNLLDITTGPDGALWFTEPYVPAIGRITTRGKITQYTTGITGDPDSIAAGPDGALWFTEQASNGGKIGRITTAGNVTEYSSGITPGEEPYGIAAGPDGAMWFTEFEGVRAAAKVGRISMQGSINLYSRGLDAQSGPSDITAGPDGRMWFVESVADKTGRLTL